MCATELDDLIALAVAADMMSPPCLCGHSRLGHNDDNECRHCRCDEYTEPETVGPVGAN